jgi:predicted nucleic acid-binding protein
VSSVFLDTVGLIALWDESDQWHDAASQVFDKIVRRRSRLVTTTYVFLECGNYASKRPYRNEVAPLRAKMQSAGDLFEPTIEEETRAWNAYDQSLASGAGIVDQVSFELMRRLGIVEAFTHDHHFRAAGFITLF